MDDLQKSLDQYEEQLAMVNLSLETVTESAERESLLSLKSDLEQLIQLTRENLDALVPKNTETTETQSSETKDELDDEYALFMLFFSKRWPKVVHTKHPKRLHLKTVKMWLTVMIVI